ncbi:unnamed protein product [Symbiodinium microadriaticum]|nr:unnamed protein product [Symbiodinium microadriaticum]
MIWPQYMLLQVFQWHQFSSGEIKEFQELGKVIMADVITDGNEHLRLVVELPTVKKSSEIKMEAWALREGTVTSNNVVLEAADDPVVFGKGFCVSQLMWSVSVESKFYLDMPLPYEVQEANGSAKFDKVVPKMPDPEALAVAQRLQGLGTLTGDGDGDVSDHEEQEPELPPLEEPGDAKEEKPAEESEVEVEKPRAEDKAEDPVVDMSQGIEELEDPQEDLQTPQRPPFVAAEEFGGAKAGYYFGKGDSGLGYYRDLRQRAALGSEHPEFLQKEPAASPPPQEPRANFEGPLVEEETNLLSTRLPVSDAEVVSEEPSVIARLGRQNLLLRLQLPDEEPEVADLRLSLVGRRLTLSFCARRLVEFRMATEAPPAKPRRSSVPKEAVRMGGTKYHYTRAKNEKSREDPVEFRRRRGYLIPGQWEDARLAGRLGMLPSQRRNLRLRRKEDVGKRQRDKLGALDNHIATCENLHQLSGTLVVPEIACTMP